MAEADKKTSEKDLISVSKWVSYIPSSQGWRHVHSSETLPKVSASLATTSDTFRFCCHFFEAEIVRVGWADGGGRVDDEEVDFIGVFISFYLSLSFPLPLYMSLYQNIFVYLSIYQSINLPIYISTYFFIYLSLSTYLPLSLSYLFLPFISLLSPSLPPPFSP